MRKNFSCCGQRSLEYLFTCHRNNLPVKDEDLSFISSGSKAPSKTQEVPELKHLPSLKPLSGSSLKKTTTSLPDRKRDCPSPLQPLRIAKQRKTSSPHSPNVSIDIESSLKTSSSSLPVPSIPPIDG